MDLRQMLDVVEQHSGRKLNDEQKAVITHGTGPLWVIAGPGSGKTEVLVLRCLKLTCVDGINPNSIIVTTFTKKAAKNIQDRLAIYKGYIDHANANLKSIDLSGMRVGTLHSLCNDIMQEYRHQGYQNHRLFDDIDQLLFVREHSELASGDATPEIYLPLWRHFHFLAERYNSTGYQWTKSKTYLPHRWIRTNATVQLFNRIVEDLIDVSQMRAKGGIWKTLADAYTAYRQSLESNKACDFAHLQLKFLGFLDSQRSGRFLRGDGSLDHPSVSHVLVDEYQDTNPIQEEIYLRLAQHPPHNLCVVGDDDQALYRFRGGTVECMVNFDKACQRAWNSQVKVALKPLSTNYRSHPDIVDWCDKYIRSFPVMTQLGARVSNKPSLVPDSQWSIRRTSWGAQLSEYPAISYLVGRTRADIANRFAQLIRGLLDNGVVNDLNQCVLLLRSTQSKPKSAGPYQEALAQKGIPIYNPRSRTFLDHPEIQTTLGALVAILDSNQRQISKMKQNNPIRGMIESWIRTYDCHAVLHSSLSDYVQYAIARISQIPANKTVTQSSSQGTTMINATIQEIFYHIISLEPFATWRLDPERRVRLGQLSKVLESYCMLPFLDNIGSTRGTLRTDSHKGGQIEPMQLNHLYHSLVGLLVSEGLNDPEDEEVICPPGRFPIMTVHQAKGLEFPFVFVSNIGIQNVKRGPELLLEDTMCQFRINPLATVFDAQQRAEQDNIRFFYVAYSRAEYSLVLLTTANELGKQGIGFGGYGQSWFTDQFQKLQ